ncbi:tRNA 5-methylaminomethyl-2-thiouridine biosynthesis bifunctional protein MnmC [Aquimixticola soesokkakensis]|uniref:tRNA 5-methylaminomethyl-2-thiouridine biosynthesis bifunctional protein MnmC n=1 Tax=Aquimixticola soesokkakensis TaxID=1519096 RepID=A0A1Y5RHR8_9RHOB|nr:tRNA (5-methylaminomethyl-2-thiouridine)(34)-methyltransferase MnmD [Aquimixticola soesokkakensis]SLN16851.1 tRNA 5-methylaminomethyl-2-thiouridine biosynthesis bifunctional protein MnmC [Aquimixticola soesokkakensis]
MTQDHRANLDWRDGVIPVSTRFDDPYFSLDNGLEETRYVFLTGNGLPERLETAQNGFAIAELGFGTGLNMLATALAYSGPARVTYTSFEAYPMSGAQIARALDAFPQARAIADPYLAAWERGARRFQLGALDVEVIEGDARKAVAAWEGAADAWFLDGFSPAKNPELWGEALMAEVARHTKAGGTFATYTAAGHVRRGLEAAGFNVERISGFGRKRHMARGIKKAVTP